MPHKQAEDRRIVDRETGRVTIQIFQPSQGVVEIADVLEKGYGKLLKPNHRAEAAFDIGGLVFGSNLAKFFHGQTHYLKVVTNKTNIHEFMYG